MQASDEGTSGTTDGQRAPTLITAERLVLRPWATTDATFHRQLWSERDPRAPARRRLTPDGHPTVTELEDWASNYQYRPAPGLLVVETRESGVAVGYCGLVVNGAGRPGEPELAYELLQEFWGLGYATEASLAIIEQARAIGYRRLVSTVRAWNTASLRVLEKLGFVNTGEREVDRVHGDSLLFSMSLRRSR